MPSLSPELVVLAVLLVGLALLVLVRRGRKSALLRQLTCPPKERQELLIQKELAQKGLLYLRDWQRQRGPLNAYFRNLQDRLELEACACQQALLANGCSSTGPLQEFRKGYLTLLEHQRSLLHEMIARADFDAALLEKYLINIDLEEHALRKKQLYTAAAGVESSR